MGRAMVIKLGYHFIFLGVVVTRSSFFYKAKREKQDTSQKRIWLDSEGEEEDESEQESSEDEDHKEGKSRGEKTVLQW